MINKLIIIIRKQKIFKRVIFVLFCLQKVKFEEIRKNCSYIIIYYNYILYIIIYEQFFLIYFKFYFL